MSDSKVESQVLKQVEFYFSNSNLPRDKFLLNLTKEDNGWVPIATLASFKRMQQLSSDMALIIKALKASPELLEVSEDDQKVRRKLALPEDLNLAPNTIYVKGLPEDSTIDSVAEFFNPKSEVKSVRLRYLKGADRKFKGSAFVEFASEEEAKKVAAETHTLAGAAEPLVVMHQPDYVNKKKEERKAKKGGEEDTTSRKRKADAEPEEKEEEVPIVPNLLLAVEDVSEETMREDLKAYIEKAGGKIAFIDFRKSETKGVIRLADPSEGDVLASDLVSKLSESKEEIHGKVPTLRALTGEEEAAYWKNLRDKKQAMKSKGGRGGRGGRGGKRGGRGGRGGKRQRKKN